MQNIFKIIFLILVFGVNAEAQTVTWSKWLDYNNLDNEGLDVIQTFDGGYLFLVNNYVTLFSTTLFKTDFLGNVEWQKIFDRNNTGGANITSYGVQQTKDSGFIFCGDSQGDSAYLIKTNNHGNLLWVKKYSRPGKEARFFGLSLTKDNGIIACGDIYSPFNGYIVKTDSSGNKEWDALYGSGAYNIIQSSDSNYYVANINYLSKFTSNGKFIWQSGFIIGSGNLGGSNIVQYSPDYIYVAGGLDSMVLNKIDSTGSVIWQKGYYNESLGCGSMCLSRDGNFLLAGEIDTLLQFDVAVAKVDPDGNLIFAKRINLTNAGSTGNFPNAVNAANDSGFIITGFTDSPGCPYRDNSLAIKTDLNCNAPKIVNISNNSSVIPNKFVLYQNFPNPFNPETKINFTIPKDGKVTLKIYDILGNEVKTLVNEFRNSGSYQVTFSGINLSSGIYYYKIESGNFTQVRKMVLIK